MCFVGGKISILNLKGVTCPLFFNYFYISSFPLFCCILASMLLLFIYCAGAFQTVCWKGYCCLLIVRRLSYPSFGSRHTMCTTGVIQVVHRSPYNEHQRLLNAAKCNRYYSRRVIRYEQKEVEVSIKKKPFEKNIQMASYIKNVVTTFTYPANNALPLTRPCNHCLQPQRLGGKWGRHSRQRQILPVHLCVAYRLQL